MKTKEEIKKRINNHYVWLKGSGKASRSRTNSLIKELEWVLDE